LSGLFHFGGIDLKYLKPAVAILLLIGIVVVLTGIVGAVGNGSSSPAIQSPGISQKPGSIQVISMPPEAFVAVDGVQLNGFTPVIATEIAPGPHTVQVTKQGYLDWTGNTTVKPGLKSYLYATLKPVNGTISVQSSPLGGTVFIDNISCGSTNVIVPDIPAGSHQVRVEKTGYCNWESSATVIGGRTTSIKATLRSDSGSLQVNSNPQGGTVVLDGSSLGKTPVLLKPVISGDHSVIIKMTGYLVYSANVTIKPGGTKYLYATLEKTPKPAHVYNVSDENKTFSLSQNDVVQVRLPENGSTGFQWSVTTTPGIELLEHSFEASNPGVAGAGGTATWLLKMTGLGAQKFAGVYKQGWMPPSVNDTTCSITFIVQ
jgi:predicted secreted protein